MYVIGVSACLWTVKQWLTSNTQHMQQGSRLYGVFSEVLCSFCLIKVSYKMHQIILVKCTDLYYKIFSCNILCVPPCSVIVFSVYQICTLWYLDFLQETCISSNCKVTLFLHWRVKSTNRTSSVPWTLVKSLNHLKTKHSLLYLTL